MVKLLPSFFFLLSLAYAQTVATEWEARKQISELNTATSAIESELAALDAQKWRDAGAVPAYLEQLDSSIRQLASARAAMRELEANPDKLGTAFEIFLRFESLDHLFDSVKEAARKYEDSSVADRLEAKIGAAFTHRDHFRSYLLDLAKERDKQFEVLSKEAQRCRLESSLPKPALKSPRKALNP